jgi:hypothetical protein
MANALAAVTKTDLRLILGMSVPDVISAISGGSGELTTAAIVAILSGSVLFAGIFLGLMKLGAAGRGWAFLVGMLIYGADTAVYALTKDWFAVAIHVWALFALMNGFKACLALRKAGAGAGDATPPSAEPDSKDDAP